MTSEAYFNYNHKWITLHFHNLWRVQRKSESHYKEGIISHYISVTEEETLRHVCLPVEAICSWTMTADPNRGWILRRYSGFFFYEKRAKQRFKLQIIEYSCMAKSITWYKPRPGETSDNRSWCWLYVFTWLFVYCVYCLCWQWVVSASHRTPVT